MIIVSILITNQGAAEVRTFLAQPGKSVQINGRILTDADTFINELQGSLQPFAFNLGHHSHPTLALRATFTSDGRQLTLVLARDSSDPDEYWVFYPAYGVTIAHVRTSSLDKY